MTHYFDIIILRAFQRGCLSIGGNGWQLALLGAILFCHLNQRIVLYRRVFVHRRLKYAHAVSFMPQSMPFVVKYLKPIISVWQISSAKGPSFEPLQTGTFQFTRVWICGRTFPNQGTQPLSHSTEVFSLELAEIAFQTAPVWCFLWASPSIICGSTWSWIVFQKQREVLLWPADVRTLMWQ